MTTINLKEAPLSIKEAKAKHILTIKNPRFWLEGIFLLIFTVVSVEFLAPFFLESITSLAHVPLMIAFLFSIICSFFYTMFFWIRLFKSFNPLNVYELEEVINISNKDTVVKHYIEQALAQRDFLYLAEYKAITAWNKDAQFKKSIQKYADEREEEQTKKSDLYAGIKSTKIDDLH